MMDCKPFLNIVKNKRKNTIGKALCVLIPKNKKHGCRVLRRCTGEEGTKRTRKMTHIENSSFYFQPIFDDTAKRETIYVCGPNQAGKSTYVANYIKHWVKGNKDVPIFVISKLDDDPVLSSVEKYIERLDVNEVINQPFDIRAYADTMLVFDDVDQFRGKTQMILLNMVEEVLCNGAHYNINIIITNHLLSDYKKTRTILNECKTIVMFPKSGCSYQVSRILNTYVGLDAEQIKTIKSYPGRWIAVVKDYPVCIVYQHGALLVE
jgi:hypothetical protein